MAAKLWVHKSASITLRTLPDNTVWISSLYSEELKQGHATELMKQVIDKADERGVTLQLDARAYSNHHEMNTGELILFCEEFGFYHLTAADKHFMERVPSGKIIRAFCSAPGHREGRINEEEAMFYCPDCETHHPLTLSSREIQPL